MTEAIRKLRCYVPVENLRVHLRIKTAQVCVHKVGGWEQ